MASRNRVHEAEVLALLRDHLSSVALSKYDDLVSKYGDVSDEVLDFAWATYRRSGGCVRTIVEACQSGLQWVRFSRAMWGAELPQPAITALLLVVDPPQRGTVSLKALNSALMDWQAESVAELEEKLLHIFPRPWFAGHLAPNEAKRALIGEPKGTFLVSCPDARRVQITFAKRRGVFSAHREPGGAFRVDIESVPYFARSLPELVRAVAAASNITAAAPAAIDIPELGLPCPAVLSARIPPSTYSVRLTAADPCAVVVAVGAPNANAAPRQSLFRFDERGRAKPAHVSRWLRARAEQAAHQSRQDSDEDLSDLKRLLEALRQSGLAVADPSLFHQRASVAVESGVGGEETCGSGTGDADEIDIFGALDAMEEKGQ